MQFPLLRPWLLKDHKDDSTACFIARKGLRKEVGVLAR
jgi:hypothetical protein